jgi:PAS domain S-box-containing protein
MGDSNESDLSGGPPTSRPRSGLPADAYQALLDNMSEGVSLSNEDGVIVYTNPAEDRIFGYGPGELIGRHVSVQNAYDADENARRVSEVIATLKETGAWRGEWLNRRKDGSVFTTTSRITAVEVDGRPHWLCVQEDVTEERTAADALRASEERLEIAAAAGGVGVWDWDVLTNRFVYSQQAKKICGLKPDQELTYEDILAVTHPDDLPFTSAQARRALDPALRDQSPYEYRVLRPDGVVRWVLARGEAVFETVEGREVATRYLGTIQDVTERRELQEAERASAQRLRLAMEASHLALWEVDLATDRVTSSPELNRLLGFAPDAAPSLEELRQGYMPGERERLQTLTAAALQAGERFVEAEFRYRRRSDGAVRWLILRFEVMLDETGAARRAVGVLTDITARKAGEAHLRLMINELNHRVKNNLATVQAIASQTLRGTESLPEARNAFMGRLLALASAHDVLTREQWEGALLGEVARGVLTPLCGADTARLRLEGPRVMLGPRAALSIAMALHELCTNAAKYGALSADGGSVDLGWSVEPGPDGEVLSLQWRERGGPAVQPPQRRGFGSRLLERAVAAELRGEVRIDFAPSGVVCAVTAPLGRDGADLMLSGASSADQDFAAAT